jgi:hypothetical protein
VSTGTVSAMRTHQSGPVLGKGEAVVRGNLEKVDAPLNRKMHCAAALSGINGSKTLPKGDVPKPKKETSKVRVAQSAVWREPPKCSQRPIWHCSLPEKAIK